jgi:hypothetical protein
MTSAGTKQPYKTSELELASFLKARRHPLTAAKMDGRLVSFEFDATAANDADNYFAGAETSARDLFEAHRSLRALIQQVREHFSQKTGSENTPHEYISHHNR